MRKLILSVTATLVLLSATALPVQAGSISINVNGNDNKISITGVDTEKLTESEDTAVSAEEVKKVDTVQSGSEVQEESSGMSGAQIFSLTFGAILISVFVSGYFWLRRHRAKVVEDIKVDINKVEW